MTLIDLPVGGRAADDTIDTIQFDTIQFDTVQFDRSEIALGEADTGTIGRNERRGVSWALAEAEATTADEPQRSSYPRCSDGNGTLTHLFFSDDEFDIARAKAICGKCGLAESCLSAALERAEPYGVWGGSLVIDGVIVEVKRGRGRPPKNPRPPLVVDEVPLPPHLVA